MFIFNTVDVSSCVNMRRTRTKQRSQTQKQSEKLISVVEAGHKAAIHTVPTTQTAFCLTTGAELLKMHINSSVCSLYSICCAWQSANPGGNWLLATNLPLPAFHIDCRSEQQRQQIQLTFRKGDTKAHLFSKDIEKNRLCPLMGVSLHSSHSFKRQIEVLSELRKAFLFSGQYLSPIGIAYQVSDHLSSCFSLPPLAFLVMISYLERI